MKKETYIKMTQPFRDNPGMAKGIHMVNKICTMIMYVAYIFLLLYMIVLRDENLPRTFLVPAISFVVLSVGRALINRPRPYETFDTPPIIKKDTKGKSFPSRHVFSVFIIAMTIFYAHPGPGIILGIIGILLGITRVRAGVHEPRDVIAGALSGILCGLIGYYLI